MTSEADVRRISRAVMDAAADTEFPGAPIKIEAAVILAQWILRNTRPEMPAPLPDVSER